MPSSALAVPRGRVTGLGLVARIAPIRNVTPPRTLDHPIWLPVVLGTVTMTDSALWTEYDTLSAGQFAQPAMGPASARQLREVPLETLTMAWEPAWFTVTGQNEIRVRNNLLGILNSRSPVHLLETFHPHASAYPEVDLNVRFTSITREIRQGEHDTRYWTIQIKEWRDPRVAAKGHRAPGERSSRKSGQILPTTAILRSTDTLVSLAQEYYGSSSRWRLIRDANHIPTRWGQSTPLVRLKGRWKTGAKVIIPALPSGGAGLLPADRVMNKPQAIPASGGGGSWLSCAQAGPIGRRARWRWRMRRISAATTPSSSRR